MGQISDMEGGVKNFPKMLYVIYEQPLTSAWNFFHINAIQVTMWPEVVEISYINFQVSDF